ncbi:hypothetical protein RFI_32500 [Reticulomyxa filosa]|uniref:Uncharacterized protein n=1 Tax=Reticulomyxa filosa TaxID=46433 RepID=X6LU76_RETFI|nr:hypothetical protein RFI_32500 [Reticulomyxa filosa]|eukprot:ETO04896.1 hypothetical protein RFI_32500 [Reticulomyxa filosa]
MLPCPTYFGKNRKKKIKQNHTHKKECQWLSQTNRYELSYDIPKESIARHCTNSPKRKFISIAMLNCKIDNQFFTFTGTDILCEVIQFIALQNIHNMATNRECANRKTMTEISQANISYIKWKKIKEIIAELIGVAWLKQIFRLDLHSFWQKICKAKGKYMEPSKQEESVIYFFLALNFFLKVSSLTLTIKNKLMVYSFIFFFFCKKKNQNYDFREKKKSFQSAMHDIECVIVSDGVVGKTVKFFDPKKNDEVNQKQKND